MHNAAYAVVQCLSNVHHFVGLSVCLSVTFVYYVETSKNNESLLLQRNRATRYTTSCSYEPAAD